MAGRGKQWKAGALILAGLALGCSEGEDPASSPSARSSPAALEEARPRDAVTADAPEAPPEKLAKRGRAVYIANCSACHAADPSQVGSLGPPVAGSSRELLEARVLHNTYPEGYTPKRDTRAMVALPFLANDIGALAAYLAP